MVRLLRDDSLVAQWQKFLEEHCKSEIETAALSYPETRSIFIDYEKIDKVDDQLAEMLLTQPYAIEYTGGCL